MKPFLLDVNVLVALLWPRHTQHAAAEKWFRRNRRHGWATCPFTEAGFVRIISNPSFSRDCLKPADAVKLLRENTAADDHRFWAVDFPIEDVHARFSNRFISHQQVTDAYLAAIAIKRGGVLVTFDSGILELVENEGTHRTAIELIEA